MPEDTPAGQSWTEVHRGQRFHLGGQVDSDDIAVPDSSPHDLDRHVVQRPAVDQQVAAGEDRREEAGKGEAGTHRRPQWPPFVNDLFSPGEVGGDAKETP